MCPEAIQKAASASGVLGTGLPDNWTILVGIAGLLAEEILAAETDDVRAMTDNVLFRIRNGEASAFDLAQMGVVDIETCELRYQVVDDVVRLLRQEWALVQKEAEYLIAEAAGCSNQE